MDAPKVALTNLIRFNALRKCAALEGSGAAKELEAAWRNLRKYTSTLQHNLLSRMFLRLAVITVAGSAYTPSSTKIDELVASYELRTRAAQEGCAPEEIEAAWQVAGALTALIACNRMRQHAIHEG